MPHLADEFDQLLRTGGVLAVGVEKLPAREKYPVWAADFMMHERESEALLSYENQVLPGLLQTEAYARATFRSDLPPLHEDEIELRVAARLERQEVLHRKEPVLASFIVSEAALKDHLGGPEVMQRAGCPPPSLHSADRRDDSGHCPSATASTPASPAHSCCWRQQTISVSPIPRRSSAAN